MFAAMIAKAGPIQIEKADFANGALRRLRVGRLIRPARSILRFSSAPAPPGPAFLWHDGEPYRRDDRKGHHSRRRERNEPTLDIAAILPRIATNDVQLIDTASRCTRTRSMRRPVPVPLKGGATAAKLTIDNPTAEPLVAGEMRAELEGSLSADR